MQLLGQRQLRFDVGKSHEGTLADGRVSGADPWKLHQQIGKHGSSADGMPPIFMYEDPDGVLEIYDGVTRAMRIAKLAPGTMVPIILIGHYRRSRSSTPSVRSGLPRSPPRRVE